jgi:hypothetical protein
MEAAKEVVAHRCILILKSYLSAATISSGRSCRLDLGGPDPSSS